MQFGSRSISIAIYFRKELSRRFSFGIKFQQSRVTNEDTSRSKASLHFQNVIRLCKEMDATTHTILRSTVEFLSFLRFLPFWISFNRTSTSIQLQDYIGNKYEHTNFGEWFKANTSMSVFAVFVEKLIRWIKFHYTHARTKIR